MGKFGISKPIVILADEPVEIGRTAAGIGYNKDRLFDLDLAVPKKEYFVDQPENKVQELIERILKDEKYRQQPYTQIKPPVGVIYDLTQNTIADIIKTCGKIFHVLLNTTGANEIYFA